MTVSDAETWRLVFHPTTRIPNSSSSSSSCYARDKEIGMTISRKRKELSGIRSWQNNVATGRLVLIHIFCGDISEMKRSIKNANTQFNLNLLPISRKGKELSEIRKTTWKAFSCLMFYYVVMRGSHDLSARKALRPKSSRPEVPPNRSRSPEGP